MPVNIGATLNHISRESSDIRRLADFYKEIFGFEEIEAPNFGEFKVIWLNLPGAFALHLIERNPGTKLPEGPYSTTSPTADPSHLPRGHHICFTVSDFDSFLQTLKIMPPKRRDKGKGVLKDSEPKTTSQTSPVTPSKEKLLSSAMPIKSWIDIVEEQQQQEASLKLLPLKNRRRESRLSRGPYRMGRSSKSSSLIQMVMVWKLQVAVMNNLHLQWLL
ncbi:VOC domain-containing protein [Citrus sinensis]|nr:VOC domain-containing protein [Citrus sinensis]